MPAIRHATAADAAAFTQVFLDCWRVSYSQIMPEALIERMTPERALSLWQDALGAGDDTYLAVEDADGGVAGFIGFRLAGPHTGYVSSLYVSPYAQGGGYGRTLLASAEQGLRDLGARDATLWVFEQNAPSRAFYEKAGWRLDGTRETLAEWGEPQVGMAREL
ncbi:GNAT family N-acetyltransferase [Leifsonia shinshuensis]|uniref:GNAT family N-acetyltransferase n=1 Tax=Leifsonia shinshuensis TaxID=150026 RepID=A0A7G6YBG2_9MICO|nr:GNAT family N-acetyltransferase [Leifsonia shinshuensis]QNE35827.1 GNAT family N-acetyltransferase [Leifsonia shinshuensis]